MDTLPPHDLAERLAAHCRDVLPLYALTDAPALVTYGSLPLCIIDAIWSINARPEAVRGVISRYCAWAGHPAPTTSILAQGGKVLDVPAPTTQTLAEFITCLERESVEKFASEIFCNRQRTSSSGGILKAEAVYRFALALRAHGLETVEHLRQRQGSGDPPAAFEKSVRAIPGQSSGVSLRTFYRLCGAHEWVTPGRSLLAFITAATGETITPDTASVLLAEACRLLTPEHPALTPSGLDALIWSQTRQAGQVSVSTRPPSTPPAPEPPVVASVASLPLPVPETITPPQSEEKEEKPAAPATSYHTRIRELPSDERPRERLWKYGADTLSTAELLAILLRTGTERMSAVDLANHLLSENGNLRGVAAMTVEEMAGVHGIGPAKAAQIKAAIEFGRRLVSASPEERPRITSPRDVYNLLCPTLRDEKREHFIALLLDTKNGVLRQHTVSVGDLSSSLVHPREVFVEAIRRSAASLIVAHNHPSGDPTPSPEDAAVTRRLQEAGELLGIDLLDHIVLGDNRWISLKEKGLM